MKIRVFALAKELNMDSKLLIDYCQKAGITIKNSALASITAEEKDRVLGLIQEAASPAKSAESKSAPISRSEMAPEIPAKARPIRTMGVKPAGKGRRDEVESVVEPIEVAESPASEFVEEATPQSTPSTTVTASSEPEGEIPASSESNTELVESPAGEVSPDSKPSDPDPSDGNAPSTVRPGPLRRSDTPAGPRRMVVMQARGSSEMSARGEAKPAPLRPGGGKQRAAGPMIADIPAFKGPVARSGQVEEPAAQKPVVSFKPGGEMPTGQGSESPLRNLINKGSKAKKSEVVASEEDLGRRGKKTSVGAGLEESRDRRKERRRPSSVQSAEDDDGRVMARRRMRVRSSMTTQTKTEAEIELPITVRTLSEAIGRPAKTLIGILFKRGEMVTINSPLSEESAAELAMELGVDLHVIKEMDAEEKLAQLSDTEDSPENLAPRPPIITILGHVDHGKTTLIDRLRSANVAASEHGGITQHIAAYQVNRDGKKLTFVDTPGHAAFGEMRARGANVTDIVVLVVAANDGVMPQTVECISHAKAANVPVVVALNKVDLPDANEQKVLQGLAQHNVLASEWGGDVEVVRTSGLTGIGLDDLLDTLLLTAELHEYKANPERMASGVCLEAFRDEGRGPLAWLVVQRGTLHVGDVVLCGEACGRVRAMYDEWDRELTEAAPSTPVKIAGLDIVPAAGTQFQVVDDIEEARNVASFRQNKGRFAALAHRGGKRSMEDILNAAREGAIQDLPLIIKADTPGSLEALRHELTKFSHPEVRVKILHEGVGGVNESDVSLASASEAVVIAFHVIAEERAEALAQAEGVDIRRYTIIYEVVDDIRNSLEGMLKPEEREVVTGRAIVLRTFAISRFGTIAGCRVLNGTIDRSNRIHLIRDQRVLNNYAIGSLRREKDDAREVREGMECGIRLEGFNDVKEGDLLEAYRIDEIKRSLD